MKKLVSLLLILTLALTLGGVASAEKKLIEYVCVAQLDRALGYGPRCRGFESSHARYIV